MNILYNITRKLKGEQGRHLYALQMEVFKLKTTLTHNLNRLVDWALTLKLPGGSSEHFKHQDPLL